MIRPLLLAGLLALVGTAASAATWTVDPAKSTLTFTGTATGQPFTGQFKTFVATIDFDPAKPEGGHVLVSVDTGSAATGDTQKDELIPGEDFFNAAKFPKAVFEATSFKALGGDKFEADGTLTIRDVKKPVVLPFTLTISGDTAHAVGTVQLMRQTFGVGQNAWAADDNVAFAVDVAIDLTATKTK
jgi:polyisoprenoid-binding protein YceI